MQQTITAQWLETMYLAYNSTGYMYEKYNAYEVGVGGGGGEGAGAAVSGVDTSGSGALAVGDSCLLQEVKRVMAQRPKILSSWLGFIIMRSGEASL